MKKDIKDYLHLYLGCDCQTPDGIMVLSAIDLNGEYPVWFTIRWNNKKKAYKPQKTASIIRMNTLIGKGFRFKEVKPILRPLSDMTEEERKKCNVPKHWHQDDLHELVDEEAWSFEQVRYMLSKHFDIFGLIEAGLAIDKNNIPKNT